MRLTTLLTKKTFDSDTIIQQLLEITEKIKQVCDSVFLDLQNAFDTVNHDILLKEMNHYGIGGIANRCFQSFLDD